MTTPPDAHDRPLRDYALIGNTLTAALVSLDGAIDWCCLPRFDSSAPLCRLLDARRGGYLQVGPAGPARASRRYIDGSAVLETVFDTGTGRLVLTDFMIPPPLAPASEPQDEPHGAVLRRLTCAAGSVEAALAFRPTFDFARRPATWQAGQGGAGEWTASDGEQALQLTTSPPWPLAVEGDVLSGRRRLTAGESAWVILEHRGPGQFARPIEDPSAWLATTLQRWRDWDAMCRHDGPHERAVRDSVRVLKLLTYSPTGSLVAAPTTSLPEWPGGVRNWDYRFCWLRDASLVLHALMSIGHDTAADQFFRWLGRLWHPGRRLQIMYGIDGREDLPEADLPHLAGWRGSRPVRIGNGAAGQTQLDIYGHVLDAASVYLQQTGQPCDPVMQGVLAGLADQAATRWREPDQGLWETRGPASHHVSSKVMCWVALDRALGLAASGKLQGDVAGWRQAREAIRETVLAEGFNARRGAFTQVLGGDTLDASVLLLPLCGFIPAGDPRMVSTVARIQEELTENGLVLRYREDDGLPGGEGAFALCSFWLVETLALQGRLTEARALFERLLGLANDVGLMSEEIDPASGELLGNHPQGYTHLAIICAALTLHRAQGHPGSGGRPA